jgi:hypothetical protein
LGVSKKGDACFEIQAILASSGEKAEVIKHAVKSFVNILKYVLVGFPLVMGSSPNPSFQFIGLWPIMDFAIINF